jgi:hypothetical protein
MARRTSPLALVCLLVVAASEHMPDVHTNASACMETDLGVNEGCLQHYADARLFSFATTAGFLLQEHDYSHGWT